MKRRNLFPLAALACLPALVRAAPAPSPERIVLTSLIEQLDTPTYRLLVLIYTEAFRQLGVEVQFRTVPAPRALAEAQAGAIDGELARGLEYETLQPSLIRVAEPTIMIALGAYGRDPGIRFNSIEELRGTRYRVECHGGYPIMEKLLAAVIPPGQLTRINHTEQGLRKVALGRTDIYIDIEDLADPILASQPSGLANVYKVGVMERRPMFAYLNRRHALLAQRLAEVLRKMRASGQLEQLRTQSLERSTAPAIPH